MQADLRKRRSLCLNIDDYVRGLWEKLCTVVREGNALVIILLVGRLETIVTIVEVILFRFIIALVIVVLIVGFLVQASRILKAL